MKLHIFHNILWSKYKGGVFSALYQIAESRGVDVKFTQIAETDADRVGLAGVDLSYHRYPYNLLFKGAHDSIPVVWRCFALFREVMRSDSDLIIIPGYHKTEYWAMLFASIILRKKRAVFCDSTAYDRPGSFYKSIAKRFFFYFCNGYFGYGERSRQYLIQHGAKPNKIFYRCQAAALSHDYDPLAVLRQRFEVVSNSEGFRFLYAGRLSWEKDLKTLLIAFSVVLRDLINSKLIIVGGGAELDELKEMCIGLGIYDQVEFKGGMPIEALAKEYLAATCFVLPSKSEPWGLVVNEALSYGCPVVVSNVCGCVPELVLDGVTGYSFSVGDPVELAKRMKDVALGFKDLNDVANRCINLISNYSPSRAAQQILDGAFEILEKEMS